MNPVFRIRGLAERGRNFFAHYSRVLAFARARIGTVKLLQAPLLDITGTLARGGIIALLASLAAVMEGKSPGVANQWMDWFAKDSFASLMLIAVPLLALLLYVSLSAFGAALLLRRCGRLMQVEVTSALLAVMPWMDRVNLGSAMQARGQLNKLMIRDVRHCGLALERMLSLLRSASQIVVSLGIVLFVEPTLSLILLALGTLIAPLVYMLTRRTQRNAQDFYQKRIRAFGAVVNQVIRRIDGANAGAGSQIGPDWLRRQSAYVDYLDAFDRHRLATEYMGFAVSFLQSVFLVCGILIFGWLALEGERSWSSVVAFLGGLYLLATGIQGFFVALTPLIRFYPQTHAAFEILERLDAAKSESIALAAPECDAIELRSRGGIPGGEGERTIKRGEIAVLASPLSLSRQSFFSFLRPLRRFGDAPDEFWLQAVFIDSFEEPPEVSIEHAVLGQHPLEQKRLWLGAFLARLRDLDSDVSFPDGPDTILTPQNWARLPRGVQAALQLASVAVEAKAALFISEDVLRRLPRSLSKGLPGELGVPFVFVVCGEADSPIQADHYVVGDERSIVGLGGREWFERSRDAVESAIGPRNRTERDAELIDELLEE